MQGTKKVAKGLALVSGGFLTLIGLLSFLPMGMFGPGGLLVRYAYVPFLHIGSGVILLAFSRMGESWAAFGLYIVAALNALVACLGYAALEPYGSAYLFGAIRLTTADLVFHLVIAVALAVCGKLNTARQQVIWD